MKGRIIGQDQGDYFVSGADGKRYQFASWDWLGKKPPKVGDTVDFVYEDNVVKSVLPLLSKTQSEKSRLAIALVCWFFGWLGIHRFMAGKVGTGIAMLLISLLSIPFTFGVGILLVTGPWSFIDFIVILSGYFRDENGDKIINW
ncbi:MULTISPECIES: TM2 domain-containing protein [unclassified Bartonella]|uniref:TM2 domain-containing protein n=1 Tax=unclassified Bartonella TaxID=2645622 RepID=UPI0035D0FF4C